MERRSSSCGWEYSASLSRIPGVTLPKVASDTDPNWHLFVIQVANRDAVREQMTRLSIETQIHYPVPIHLQPAYKHLGYVAGDFPRAEKLADSCLLSRFRRSSPLDNKMTSSKHSPSPSKSQHESGDACRRRGRVRLGPP